MTELTILKAVLKWLQDTHYEIQNAKVVALNSEGKIVLQIQMQRVKK